MPFLIKDENLLGKCNKIWGEKVSNIIQKEFDRNPVELNLIMEKINTTFYNKVPKESPEYICLSVILLDTVYKNYKNYYPEVLSEECKYVI